MKGNAMELTLQQYEILDKLKENADHPQRKWISVEHEDPDVFRPLVKAGLAFIKNGQIRITARGILRLEEDQGWIKPEQNIRTYYPSNGLDLDTLCRIQNEILDHFEKKYPEIKHIRAIKLIQAKLAHKK